MKAIRKFFFLMFAPVLIAGACGQGPGESDAVVDQTGEDAAGEVDGADAAEPEDENPSEGEIPDIVVEDAPVEDTLPDDAPADPDVPEDELPPLPGCPASQPAHGETGCGYVGQACTYGSAPCLVECRCLMAYPTTYWDCPEPAGCSSRCPEATPDPVEASPCDGFEGAYCRFSPGECGYACGCPTEGGYWNCSAQCHCGEAPPPPSTCAPAFLNVSCRYGDGVCGRTTDCSCEEDGWRCIDPCAPSPCPSAPDPGGTCDEAAIGPAGCAYTGPPYCRTCHCVGGVFDCTDSECDECPASPPEDGSECPSVRERCAWPDPDGSGDILCTCNATDDGPPAWDCWEV